MKTFYKSDDGKEFDSKEECQKHEEKKLLKRIENIDIVPLKELVTKYAEFVCSDEYYEDNYYMGYIFETAIEMFYGDDFWKLFNIKK